MSTLLRKIFLGARTLPDNSVKKRAYFYVQRNFLHKVLVRANGKPAKIFLQKQKVKENIPCAKWRKGKRQGPAGQGAGILGRTAPLAGKTASTYTDAGRAQAMKNTVESQIEAYRREGYELLKKLGEKAVLARGETLRRPDKSSMDVYFLVEGLCALCMEATTGKDMALIYFLPGRMLNFLPALEKYYPRTVCELCYQVPFAEFYVRAIKTSELLRINYQRFLEEFAQSLPLQTVIIQSLVQNCYDLFTHLLKSLEMPAWQRVARELVENMSGPEPHILPRKITYGEIATHLSIHTVTVAKIFRALQDNGIIERVKDGIMIRDPLRIWRIANGEERLFYKSKSGKRPSGPSWQDFEGDAWPGRR